MLQEVEETTTMEAAAARVQSQQLTKDSCNGGHAHIYKYRLLPSKEWQKVTEVDRRQPADLEKAPPPSPPRFCDSLDPRGETLTSF